MSLDVSPVPSLWLWPKFTPVTLTTSLTITIAHIPTITFTMSFTITLAINLLLSPLSFTNLYIHRWACHWLWRHSRTQQDHSAAFCSAQVSAWGAFCNWTRGCLYVYVLCLSTCLHVHGSLCRDNRMCFCWETLLFGQLIGLLYVYYLAKVNRWQCCAVGDNCLCIHSHVVTRTKWHGMQMNSVSHIDLKIANESNPGTHCISPWVFW